MISGTMQTTSNTHVFYPAAAVAATGQPCRQKLDTERLSGNGPALAGRRAS
jgi:hypothetical protein